MRYRTLICFRLSYVVSVSSAWRNVGMTVTHEGLKWTIKFKDENDGE